MKSIIQTEILFNSILIQQAELLVAENPKDLILPYWARNAYLRLIQFHASRDESNALINKTRQTLILMREPNGMAIFHPEGNIIALDLVLEPILKNFNGIFGIYTSKIRLTK